MKSNKIPQDGQSLVGCPFVSVPASNEEKSTDEGRETQIVFLICHQVLSYIDDIYK